MNTLDRMYFVGFLRNYLIVLVSLLSLYVVVDLFTNLNDFTNNKPGFGAVLKHIAAYYSVQVLLIFDRLSEAITLIGAVFTVAWMQRNNELLPQLSAGVPTRRVIRPILLGGMLATSFGPLVTEFVIPMYATELTKPRDDPDFSKPAAVRGGFDPATDAHLVGEQALRQKLKITKFQYTSAPFGDGESGDPSGPAVAGSGLLHLTAEEAVYIPPADGNPLSGGWDLYECKPPVPDPSQTLPKHLRHLAHGRYFLRSEVSFDAVTRRASWYMYSPTTQLWYMLKNSDGTRQPGVAVLFHVRIVRPLVGLTMLVLGLGIVLRNQNRHVFISAGACLAVTAVFYVAVLGSKYAGDNDFLPAALAAWLPVMVFGPFAFALFDAMHT